MLAERVKRYLNFESCTEEELANDLLSPRGMALGHLLFSLAGNHRLTTATSAEAAAGLMLVLGKICNEGDNAFDGRELAVEMINVLGLLDNAVSISSISVPESWITVFGKELVDDLMFY